MPILSRVGMSGSALSGVLELKGAIDGSGNPNYPVAEKGDLYLISVAGKVGGGSGASVDAGDMVVAVADNAGGTQASVGTSWAVIEHNLPALGTAATKNVGTGSSDVASAANVNPIWRSDLMTEASLQAVATVALAIGVMLQFSSNMTGDGSTVDTFLLVDEDEVGDQASLQPSHGVTPNDYNASTNKRWWALVARFDSSGANGLGSIYLPESGGILSPRLLQVTAGVFPVAENAIGNTIIFSVDTNINVSYRRGIFTGATPRNFTLPPIGASVSVGWDFLLVNGATAVLTIKDSTSATITTLQPGESAYFFARATTDTWQVIYFPRGSNGGATALTDAATITWTVNPQTPNQMAKVTLGGNRTLAISGAVAGMQGKLLVKQDGTGSRTLTLPAGSKVAGGGAGAIALTATANATDELIWEYDGTNYFWSSKLNYT